MQCTTACSLCLDFADRGRCWSANVSSHVGFTWHSSHNLVKYCRRRRSQLCACSVRGGVEKKARAGPAWHRRPPPTEGAAAAGRSCTSNRGPRHSEKSPSTSTGQPQGHTQALTLMAACRPRRSGAGLRRALPAAAAALLVGVLVLVLVVVVAVAVPAAGAAAPAAAGAVAAPAGRALKLAGGVVAGGVGQERGAGPARTAATQGSASERLLQQRLRR